MFHAYRQHVLRLIDEHKPDVIAGEQSILPRPHIKFDARGRPFIFWPTNLETTMLLQGLWAILEQVSHSKGIELGHVDVGTVKKELAGFGKAKKPDMVAAAEKVGLSIAVHDEADAFAVWLVAVRLKCSRDISMRWDRLLYGSRGFLL
jgi:hypothetical protein